VYGPVRTVVWQGSAGDRRPYADQNALAKPDQDVCPTINQCSEPQRQDTSFFCLEQRSRERRASSDGIVSGTGTVIVVPGSSFCMI